MGALAALGLVLCARACRATSPVRGRCARRRGAGGRLPLGMGVYLSFSRGALAALAAGLIAVFLLRTRARVQLRAVPRRGRRAGAAGALSAAAAGAVCAPTRAAWRRASARERSSCAVRRRA
jgi:O-antigen ligase